MKNQEKQIYNAAIYVRLSREDGDISSGEKSESNSISNQRELIENYLKQVKNIKVVQKYVDDGYSGTNFERPGFKQMLQDIKEGLINCVVVKDLSRFGRDYIDAGKYIEKIFPRLGVRFIAINDQYDSLSEHAEANGLIIPFKNLINDAYARDISIKVRSHLDMKRKRGDFIGPFTPYGYKKANDNKNQLVIDQEAADIVRRIYRLKIQGYSEYFIANKLNTLGILSPLAYKNASGINLQTGFETSNQTKWSPVAIQRILENEIYTGVLIQGKRSTPNYKVKQVVFKAESEWIRVLDAQEAIILPEEFKIVKRLLKMDTRTSPTESKLHLFSGLVECGDCGGSMIRKLVPYKDKKYAYLLCSTYKNKKGCNSHQISEKGLKQVVLEILKAFITEMTDVEEVYNSVSAALISAKMTKRHEEQIQRKQEEMKKYKGLIISLYEDLVEELINKDEYHTLKMEFQSRIETVEQEIRALSEESTKNMAVDEDKLSWLKTFRKYKNINCLDRTLLIELVDRIVIHDRSRIEIQFRNQDYYETLLTLFKEV